jgi:hypothetical protein
LNRTNEKSRKQSNKNSSNKNKDVKKNLKFSNAGNQGLYIQKAPAREFDNGTVAESVSLGDRLAAKKKYY